MKSCTYLLVCAIILTSMLPRDLQALDVSLLTELIQENNKRWSDERLPSDPDFVLWNAVAHGAILDCQGHLLVLEHFQTSDCPDTFIRDLYVYLSNDGLILNVNTLETAILKLDQMSEQLSNNDTKKVLMDLLEFAKNTHRLLLTWMPSEVRSQISSSFGELERPTNDVQPIVKPTSPGTASISAAEAERIDFAKKMSVGIGDESAITVRGNGYKIINFMTPDMSNDIAILLYPKVKDLLIQYGFERAEFTDGGDYKLVLKPLEGEPVSTDSQSLSEAAAERLKFAKYLNDGMEGEATITVRGNGFKIFNYSTPIMTNDYGHLLYLRSKEKLIELGFEWAEYTDGGNVNFAYNLKL